jgi:hypothetical protein
VAGLSIVLTLKTLSSYLALSLRNWINKMYTLSNTQQKESCKISEDNGDSI